MLGADTVVVNKFISHKAIIIFLLIIIIPEVFNDTILEKPLTTERAREMLTL